MRIYCIRHGEWHERLDDFAPEGRTQLEKAARTVRRLGLESRDVMVLTSPQKRAVTSAKFLCRELGFDSPIETPWLDDNVEFDEVKRSFAFITRLKLVTGIPAIFMVGHRPTLEKLVEFLTGREVSIVNGDVWEIDLKAKTVTKLP